MGGAANRRKGHAYEVKSANELSERLHLDIRTTRSLGANYGADVATVTGYDAHGRPALHIPTILGWSVECKAVASRSPGKWLKQAEDQMVQGAIPVVLWRRLHKPWDQGLAFLRDEEAPRRVAEVLIEEWLEMLPI